MASNHLEFNIGITPSARTTIAHELQGLIAALVDAYQRTQDPNARAALERARTHAIAAAAALRG